MHSLPYFILMSATVGATSAYAQSDPQFDLGTIVLQSGGIEDVEITSEDLDRSNPGDLQDVFKSEPTLTVSSSIPASQKLFVNGIEEVNLNVTIDGGRQNNKIFHHSATNLIDPDLLKQVRIDPGVAPADAGPGALGGAVAFETKDVDDLLAEGLSFGGAIEGEYNSNGDTWASALTLYGRSGGFEALGFVKYADGDVREDGSDVEIIGSGTHLLSGLGKVAYTTDSGSRFELSYERVKDDEARPYRGDIGQIIGGRPVPLTRTYDIERQNLVFSYTETQAKGWWDPKVVLAYGVTDLVLPEEDQISRGMTDSLNGVISNRFAVANGTVTAGLDFYMDQAITDYRYLPDSSFNEAGSEKSRNVGIFAQARLDVTDRARVSFGGRVDFQEFEGLDGSKQSENGWSGNLSGEYDLTDAVTVSAGYSHVWGGIPLAENFIMSPTWSYPADGLEAVESDNFYAAARAELGAFTLKAKYFQTEIDNARTPSYRGGPDLTTDLDTKGYELGLQYNWTNGFASIAYADIETDLNGLPADSYSGRYLSTPIGEVISLQVAQALPEYGLTFGADAQFALKETGTYSADPANPVGLALPAYEVANAFVEYRPRQVKGLTIRGEINNIFDETYANRGTYGQEFSEIVPLNEPGRSFKLSAKLRF